MFVGYLCVTVEAGRERWSRLHSFPMSIVFAAACPTNYIKYRDRGFSISRIHDRRNSDHATTIFPVLYTTCTECTSLARYQASLSDRFRHAQLRAPDRFSERIIVSLRMYRRLFCTFLLVLLSGRFSWSPRTKSHGGIRQGARSRAFNGEFIPRNRTVVRYNCCGNGICK